jgi:heptaprenyl diphosphate synthase
LALLGSLCLFLSALEYLIPKPLPFMRIGLANLPLLLALDLFGPARFLLLALIKIIGQGIITGSLFSYVFLFSFAGTVSSGALMYIMRHVLGAKRAGLAGIGCAGAMLSNGVQLLLARYFVFGAGLRFLAPPFLASGLISGAALGLFCETFCRRSQWYAAHAGNVTGRPVAGAGADVPAAADAGADAAPGRAARRPREERRLRRRRRWNDFFNSEALFITGLVMTLCFLLNPSPLFRIPQFVFFCFLAWLSGKKTNFGVTALVMAGIVFCNLLAPYGKVLAAWGPLRVTQGSLLAGLGKAVTVEGLAMLSAACVRPGLRLPGSLGALLAESFRILELARERQALVRRSRVIEGIDRLLLELEALSFNGAPPDAAARRGKPGQSAKSLLLLAGLAALTLVLGNVLYRLA